MIGGIHKLGRVLLVSFVIVTFGLGYWGVAVREEMLAREENPRLVIDEQLIQRGLILDRNEVVLAESVPNQQTGLLTRIYPHPGSAPVVGYYSIRHGVGGIEAEFDDILRGTAGLTTTQRMIDEILHRSQIGGDVRLTLDYRIQDAVVDLLNGERGAVVVITVPQGEVLAMASAPIYDPNQLDERWDDLFDNPAAPLVNRATQGLYQPGTILQSILAGAAMDNNLSLTMPVDQRVWSADIDGTMLPCAEMPSRQIGSLEDAYYWACPAPFGMLGLEIEARRLDAALTGFGLLEAPEFALQTEPSDPIQAPAQANLLTTAFGQSQLTVTPLQMVQVAAAFANHGEIPALQLVRGVRLPDGAWQTVEAVGHPRGTVSRASADAVAQLMRQTVQIGAAQAANIDEYRIYGHAGLAVGGDDALNAWFIGFAYRPNGQAVAVAVLLENEEDASAAAVIGGHALKAALDNLD